MTFSRGPWVGALVGLLMIATLATRISAPIRVALVATMVAVLVASSVVLGRGATVKAQPARLVSSAQLRLVTGPTGGETTRFTILNRGTLVRRLNLPPPGPVRRVKWLLAGHDVPVLSEPPPARGRAVLAYRVYVPPDTALAWGIALDPRVWSPERGDGVTFRLAILDGPEQDVVFARYLDPKNEPGDRRPFYYRLPLFSYAGDTVTIVLSTDAGPRGDADYDWAAWLNPRLVTLPRGASLDRYPYAPAPIVEMERPLQPPVAYFASVADWSGDQSNTDRVAAWRRTLTAWTGAPLLGLGPGSVDEAALRAGVTQPLVTESQVGKALAETGIVGLMLWLALVLVAATAVFRRWRTARDEDAVLVLAALSCIVVTSLAFQVLEVKQIALLFWSLIGVVAAWELEPVGMAAAVVPAAAPRRTRFALGLPLPSLPLHPGPAISVGEPDVEAPAPAVPEASPSVDAAVDEPLASTPVVPADAVPAPMLPADSMTAPRVTSEIPASTPALWTIRRVSVLRDDTAVNERLDAGWRLLAVGVEHGEVTFVMGLGGASEEAGETGASSPTPA